MIAMCLMLRKFSDAHVFILGLLIMHMEYNLTSVHFTLCISTTCYIGHRLAMPLFLMIYEHSLH